MHTLSTLDTPAAPRQRNRFAALLAAGAALVCAVGIAGVATATPALAHDELVGQRLVLDDVDSVSGVQLSFSDEILTDGTEIAVTDPDGTDVTGGEPEHDGRDVVQPVEGQLEPGEYRVVWRVVSSDGHPIEGAFAFDVDEGMSDQPEFRPFDPSEPASGDEEAASADAAEDTEARDASNDGAGYLLPALIGVGALAAIGAVVVIVVKNRKRPAGGAGRDGGQTDR